MSTSATHTQCRQLSERPIELELSLQSNATNATCA